MELKIIMEQNIQKQTAMLLSEVIKQKRNQGYAVRTNQPLDYDSILLNELHRMENFSSGHKDALCCLSKCIRRKLWMDNTLQLATIIGVLNDASEILSDIITPEVYWNINTIVDYIYHLYHHGVQIGVLDSSVFEEIIDRVIAADSKTIIEKQWEDILRAEDGNKAFIDVFDDVFKNSIEKHEDSFIHTLKDTDIMNRMVKETHCNESRFIPWTNKVQNRWNPPGKTFLYLSYGVNEIKFNEELSLGEYICLLECRTDPNTDVCFCRFKPEKEGRILDLSYNDITLSQLRGEMEQHVQSKAQSTIDILLNDSEIVRRMDDQDYVQDKIKRTMDQNPISNDYIEVNCARQILKLICGCIYKKVDESTDSGKEKAYKSFHILAEYLEKQGITGVVYPCTRSTKIKGKNIVLFNKDDATPVMGSVRPYHFRG